VIPTYNRPDLVVRAIRSVLAQSFGNFEVVVVDDHSSYAFEKVTHVIQDGRVRYIRREHNGGNAATRNTGVRNAQGDFVSFLDDDDEYMPDFLEKSYQRLKDAPPSVGFAWCGTRRVRDDASGEQVLLEETWQPTFQNREDAYLSFLQSRRVGTDCGLTVRRICFEAIGMFDESLRKAVDTDFLIRLVREFDFIVVPEVLIKIHDHSGPRVRTNFIHGAESYEKIMAKHGEALQSHPKIQSAKHYKTAWLFYHGGNKVKARQHMQQALRLNPAQPKYWMIWVMLEVLDKRGSSLHRQLSSWKRHLIAGNDLL
jgi:glycosyltransferase involved in cell wall biosynthesis